MYVGMRREKLLYLCMLIAACMAGISLLYLASAYLELSRQFIVGWGLIGLLIIFNRIEQFKRPPLRIIFIVMAAFVSLRYLFWRTFDTLIYTGPLDFIGTIALYLAEIYVLIIHFLGLHSNIWPLKRKPAPLPDKLDLYPTVDVFIPTYNESEEIVRITAIAATHINYPKDKICIHILDDGSTVARRNNPKTSSTAWERYHSFQRMARELDVNYITRETNKHAKSGNLNHALHHTNSELILMLDCDHVPTRDILKNTVGWFLKDEKLFLVQTPHFFINPNPLEKNLAIFNDAPTENEMFYRGIHLGHDFWNSSYFCGSAAVLKRKYLEEAGGIAGDTITEDAETTISLHSRGYNSVYIDRPMVCGLSPDTFDDFIIQRSRWAQGMIQIFILKNPLFAKGMQIHQRICYLGSCIFWFFGISRFIFYIIPAAFLLFGLKVYHASFIQVVAYTLPHVMCSIIITNFFFGKLRWPFFSELYENVQSIFMLPVIFSVIVKPRAPTFKVTPKGKNLEETLLNPMAIPYFIMLAVIVVCIPVAIIRWFYEPLYRDVIIITFGWTIFNLFIAMVSLGAFMERKQVRRHHRMWAKGKVNVFFPRLNKTIQGEIKDISFTGMGLELNNVPFSIKPEEDVELYVRDIYGDTYRFQAVIYRHIKKGNVSFCGCNFVSYKDVITQLVKFMYGDSQRWKDFWEKKSHRVNPLVILFFMVRVGAKGSQDCIMAIFRLIFAALKKTLSSIFANRRIICVKE